MRMLASQWYTVWISLAPRHSPGASLLDSNITRPGLQTRRSAVLCLYQLRTVAPAWRSYTLSIAGLIRELNSFSRINSKLSQFCDWLRTGRPGFDPRRRQRIFLLASASRPALGPPSLLWVLSPGVKRGRGVTLTTHFYLVPRLSVSRSYTSPPPKATMTCSGTVYNHINVFVFT
jgi:hypothetical protein